MISYTDVKKLNKKGNVIPLYKRIASDLDTPVTAFLKLAATKRNSFLLESVEGGETIARYSFLGFDPFLVIKGEGDSVIVQHGKEKRSIDCPLPDFIKELFAQYRPVQTENLPRFTGGAVGYFSYDTIRFVENIPDNNRETIGLPLAMFGLYRNIVVFDRVRQEIIVISNILHEDGVSGLQKKYKDALSEIEKNIKKIRQTLPKQRYVYKKQKTKVTAHTTSYQFEKIVRRAKRYIREGDIFQVVLSQRWDIKSKQSALAVYRKLRRINPSPYMFLLNFGDVSIIGASPEMMVRVEDNEVETRPIAGTRPRGKNTAEDEKFKQSLLADPKEIAEHTMLLDLGRNDIGQVSKAGSVRIKENMIVEKYSHVMHIVSSVSGKLKKSYSPIDGHFSCFPAGTVSGAPKIRAMEIIDELEDEKRGVYAGSIAYLDFWGNLDSCIAIRTVVKNKTEFYVQAGAGIVADSKPAKEYQETVDKASAVIEAIIGDISI